MIGYPAISVIDHVINLAELATLVGLTYVALLGFVWAVTAIGGQSAASGREVLREVRASFYRKLFLAFLAASLVPVLILAYATRAFFANQLRAGIQSDAVRVAAVAQRVVEEYEALRQREAGAAPDDEIMVWLSRAIAQDVNIYHGSQLLATSERDLFESGLLPERTPGPVYRAIVLDRLSSNVSEGDGRPDTLHPGGRAGARGRGPRHSDGAARAARNRNRARNRHAGSPRAPGVAAVCAAGRRHRVLHGGTDRRSGQPADPRHAPDRRVATSARAWSRRPPTSCAGWWTTSTGWRPTSSASARELERTHRLEAWAEMARQVAHEIKNPLTPIQLSSEHLVRVNKDKGLPLTPVRRQRNARRGGRAARPPLRADRLQPRCLCGDVRAPRTARGRGAHRGRHRPLKPAR